MLRRNETIVDDLAKCPWWVSVVLSATAFVGPRFVLPLFVPSGPATASNYAVKGMLCRLSPWASFIALFLVILAPIAAFRQWRGRSLVDKQEGLVSIRALSWARFETLVAEAYRRQRYSVSRTSGNGPDGGVDLVLRKDGNTLLAWISTEHHLPKNQASRRHERRPPGIVVPACLGPIHAAG